MCRQATVSSGDTAPEITQAQDLANAFDLLQSKTGEQ